MASSPEEKRKVLKNQEEGTELLRRAHFPGIAVLAAVISLFSFASIERSALPAAFIPTFLIGVVMLILGLAYVMIVMIRKGG